MMNDRDFLRGMLFGVLGMFFIFLGLQIFFMRIGELNLDSIIKRQLSEKNILFSSGINQDVFRYKLKLYDEIKPDVVVMGSSRVMQMREEFFSARFLNMGGTISNVSDLENLAKKLASRDHHPKLLILGIDPWWFNHRYPGAMQPHSAAKFPDFLNADIISSAVTTLERGNWLKNVNENYNLGIYAILTHEGFSADGSYHYTDTISGRKALSDIGFENTLWRIQHSTQRFEKSEHVDITLVDRTCDAIRLLKRSTGHLVIIAPPFSHTVWQRMEEGGYEYIEEIGNALDQCINDVAFHDFTNPRLLPASNDCEFIDGFHGGDTISARMLLSLLVDDKSLDPYLRQDYLKVFLTQHAGHAAGITTEKITQNREVDFLRLGCRK